MVMVIIIIIIIIVSLVVGKLPVDWSSHRDVSAVSLGCLKNSPLSILH